MPRSGPVPFQEPDRVIVAVGLTPGVEPPGLASAIRDQIAEQTGVDVTTRVEYVQTERS